MKPGLKIYYAVLIGLLFTWTSSTLPPMFLRFGFLCLAVVPVIISRQSLYPCILSMFVILSANRSVPSYMPSLPIYLALVTLVFVLVCKKQKTVKPPAILLLVVIATAIIDLWNGGLLESISITAFTVYLFYGFIGENIGQRADQLSWSLVIISALLCLELLFMREDFTYAISVGEDDYTRVGWSDPNYFTGLIGMGAMAALHLLSGPGSLEKWKRYALFGVILEVVVVSLLIASRGGFFALMTATSVTLLFSRRDKRLSFRIFVLLLFFAGILYYVGAFDLMLSRFANDEGDLGGRRIIWFNKLSDFSQTASLSEWIFGLGKSAGFELSAFLGDRDVIGFHNDYIAFLICYGIIGLLLLLAMLVYPIIKYKDIRITGGILYMMVISFSLEPIFNGALDFMYFYFYLCILGAAGQKNKAAVEYEYV